METLGWIVLYLVGYVLAYLIITHEAKTNVKLAQIRQRIILLLSFLSWVMVTVWLLDEVTDRYANQR